EDRKRRVAVSPPDRLEEIALLGFRRKTRRGAAALYIDDDERKLRHDGEADGFGLERHARARGARDAECSAEARTDRGRHRRDLIFGLKGGDAKIFEACEVVKERRGGRDRIRSVIEGDTDQFSCVSKSKNEGCVV